MITSHCSMYQLGRRQMPAVGSVGPSATSGSSVVANSSSPLVYAQSGIRTASIREVFAKTKSAAFAKQSESESSADANGSPRQLRRAIVTTSSGGVSCSQTAVSSPGTVASSLTTLKTFQPASSSTSNRSPPAVSTQHQVIAVTSLSTGSSFAQAQHPPLLPSSSLSSSSSSSLTVVLQPPATSSISPPPPPPPPPMPSFVHHSYTTCNQSQPQSPQQQQQQQQSVFFNSAAPSRFQPRHGSTTCASTGNPQSPSTPTASVNGVCSSFDKTPKTPPTPLLVSTSTSCTSAVAPVPPPPPPLSCALVVAPVPLPPPLPPPLPLSVPSIPAASVASKISFTVPRSRTRRLQWQKLSSNSILQTGKPNIWKLVVERLQQQQSQNVRAVPIQPAAPETSPPLPVDFDTFERMFAVENSPTCGSSTPSASDRHLNGIGKDAMGSGSLSSSDKKRNSNQVELLDNRRCLNINIFLRQFRSNAYGELIKWLSTADSESIGADKLRSLVKILPAEEEMDAVLNYKGDQNRLGLAERFCRDLAKLPHYRVRIDALLMKEEFNQTIDFLKPAIDAVVITAKELLKCEVLRDILATVLLIGNFLNAGAYAGDAIGFRLQSLTCLAETRANGGRISLLHLVVTEMERQNGRVVAEIQSFKYLREASQCCVDTISADISTLRQKLKSISSQISKTDDEFQRQMESFLEFADDELKDLETDVGALESLRHQLAVYFCEDEKTFKLDECLKLIATFFDAFVKASQENHERQLVEAKAEERRRQRTELMHAKLKSRDGDQSKPTWKNELSKGTRPTASQNGSISSAQCSPSGTLSNGFSPSNGYVSFVKSASPVKSSRYDNDVREIPDTDGLHQSYSEDLLDILLSRDNILCGTSGGAAMNRSDSLTRRKRRPKTAEHDGSSVDRERSRQSSPVTRCPSSLSECPSQETRLFGRRVSLPVTSSTAMEPAGGLMDRSIAVRRATGRELLGLDRDQCIRLAQLVDRRMKLENHSENSNLQTSAIDDVSLVRHDAVIDGDAVNVVSSPVHVFEPLSSFSEGCEFFVPNDVTPNEIVGNDKTNAVFDGSSNVAAKPAQMCPYRPDDLPNNFPDVVDSDRRVTANEINGHYSPVPAVDDANTVSESVDESTKQQIRRSQSFNCYSLPSPTASGGSSPTSGRNGFVNGLAEVQSSAFRTELETQFIDGKVQEFQNRLAPEREALKNRLRKLSQMYMSGDEEVKTWPISASNGRRFHDNALLMVDGDVDVDSDTKMQQLPLTGSFDSLSSSTASSTALDQAYSNVHHDSLSSLDGSAIGSSDAVISDIKMSSGIATVLQKFDAVSMSSRHSRDEGFESASLSSDLNLSVSQRSSVCEGDPGTSGIAHLDLLRRDITSTVDGSASAADADEAIEMEGASDNNGPPLDNQSYETLVDQDLDLDLEGVSCRSSVENCFARSIDSLVMKNELTAVEFENASSLENENIDDDNGNDNDTTSHLTPQPTVTSPTSDGTHNTLNNDDDEQSSFVVHCVSQTVQSASKLKPKAPVRGGSSNISSGSSRISAPAAAVAASQPKTAAARPSSVNKPPLSLSRTKQVLTKSAVRPSPNLKSPQSISASEAALRKAASLASSSSSSSSSSPSSRPTLDRRARPLQTPPSTRAAANRSTIQPPSANAFVRSSAPRATIAAPALRANKKVAAEARTNGGAKRTTGNVNASLQGTPPIRASKVPNSKSSSTTSLASMASTVRSMPPPRRSVARPLKSAPPSASAKVEEIIVDNTVVTLQTIVPINIATGSSIDSKMHGKPRGSKIPAPGGSKLRTPSKLPVHK